MGDPAVPFPDALLRREEERKREGVEMHTQRGRDREHAWMSQASVTQQTEMKTVGNWRSGKPGVTAAGAQQF